MVVTNKINYQEGICFAVRKAREKQTPILFSYVEKINDVINPLSFYKTGRHIFKGECFFWQDPEKEAIVTGAGQLTKIQEARSNDRYENVEKSWHLLRKNAVTSGEIEIDATGPLLFGGFSFDPEKDTSNLWSSFGSHLFYVPRFMLSIVKGQPYLTINLICKPDDEEEGLFYQIEEKIKELLKNNRYLSKQSNQLLHQTEINPSQWKQTVEKAIKEMKHTSLDKVVLARELRLLFQDVIQPEEVLGTLMEEQPGSYIFSLESGEDCFIGATPEKLIKKRGLQVFSDCLAGSIGRGNRELEDERLGKELLQDSKNLLEHHYVVSMIKDAFDSLCSEVNIPEGPVLMKNRHIQHLYTPISGICHSDATVLNFVERLHPTPAMGGMPQKRAVTRIRELETLERGFYAGPLGWIDAYGNSEFAVGIRSALLRGQEASLFAGGGVLKDSTPDKEYNETAIKFNPMLSALGGKLHE